MSFLLDAELKLARHALGCWDGFGRRPVEGHRNYFVATKGSNDDRRWQSMVTRGLATTRHFHLDESGNSSIYYVTREGARLAGLSEAAVIRACGTDEERRRLRQKRDRDKERKRAHARLFAIDKFLGLSR